jgi:hypothetical protein
MAGIDSTRSLFLTAILVEENFQPHMNQIIEDRIEANGYSSLIIPRKEVKVHKVRRKTGRILKSDAQCRKFWKNIEQLVQETDAHTSHFT